MLWWTAGLAVVAAAVATLHAQKVKFSCEGRTSGYYADVPSGCQVYHMCDGLGRQFSYTCPNATLFQQRMLICDHWYMVNCSKSEADYTANLLIGQKGRPFVDDSDAHPYHRTPRPDLLSHPTDEELNIIYRTGRAHLDPTLNLVGAASDPQDATSSTDQPVYWLPSHWSTEYSAKEAASDRPVVAAVEEGTPKVAAEPVSVNFGSEFMATTPVFPLTVDPTTVAPDTLGILPPLPYKNAKSGGQAPQGRREVAPKVNFESRFMATTPVYPLSVESTSIDPGDLGVLAPVEGEGGARGPEPLTKAEEARVGGGLSTKIQPLSIEFEPPKVDENFQRPNEEVDIVPDIPSKFYQPPKFEPDYTIVAQQGELRTYNPEDWELLRKKFFIPDYDFPLESVSRPSYDTVFNSFQASATIPQR